MLTILELPLFEKAQVDVFQTTAMLGQWLKVVSVQL